VAQVNSTTDRVKKPRLRDRTDRAWFCHLLSPLCTTVYSAFHPSGVGKWVPAAAGKAKAVMAHSDYRWTCWCAGKTVKSLENTCRTSAFLQWWFTTKRRYIKCMHLYLCEIWLGNRASLFLQPRSPHGARSPEDNIWGLLVRDYFTDRMPFLSPNPQCQSIEGRVLHTVERYEHVFGCLLLMCCQVTVLVILIMCHARTGCSADTITPVFCTSDRLTSVCKASLYPRHRSFLAFSSFNQKLRGHRYCHCDYFCDLAQNTAVCDSYCDRF